MNTNISYGVVRRSRRRGVVLIYVVATFAVMCGIISLGVDFARVQVAKTELQRATDAAARFGATGLNNILFGVSSAPTNAVAVAAQNLVDGSPLVLDPVNDVTLGIWNTSTHKFTANSDPSQCNAVRVVSHRAAARGTAIPMTFAKLIGFNSCDIHSTSIAMLIPGVSVTVTVPATSNPFLAGMPAGSVASLNNPHNDPDFAGTTSNPRSSPVTVNGINVTPGASMSFDGINGGANNDFRNPGFYSADGNAADIESNTAGDDSNIGNITGPLNSLVGVYLGPDQPNLTPPPTQNYDFSTDAARDYSTLQPQLKQVFFIGDGRQDNGQVQQVIVPKGATRLFLGTWDGYEWSNNVGSFQATVHQPGQVVLVQ